jgi:hypothetical protein
MPAPPPFTTPTLLIRPWPDAVIDEVGHDPRSPYVEHFWLGVLGPTATWLLRRLAAGLEEAPAGFELDLTATASELGVGNREGPQSPMVRSIHRCRHFGLVALPEPSTLQVRRKLPPLNRMQVARLAEPLQRAHDQWVAAAGPGSALRVEQLRNRARHLALSLLELGEDGEATERQLHRWRVHPAMAHDATAWALARHRAARAEPAPAALRQPPDAA